LTKKISDTPGLDTSDMTLEERVARLETMIEVIGKHQANLGASLIRAHQNLIAISKDILGANVSRGTPREEIDLTPGVVGYQPAPLIIPGPHPLRPTPRRDY
jgi:hypothetical protein